MREVYVVTMTALADEAGEFYRAEAYVSEVVARVVAGECMESNGGRDRYREVVDVKEPLRHVVQQWVSSRFSVYVERLEIVR